MISNGQMEQAQKSHADRNRPGLVEECRSFFLHTRQLAYLQGLLFAKDLGECRSRLVRGAVALLAGLVLLVGCIPVLLAAVAMALAAGGPFDVGTCMFIVCGVAVLAAAVLFLVARQWLGASARVFARSRGEFEKNIQSLFGGSEPEE